MAAELTMPFKGAVREGSWSSPFAGAVREERWQPEAPTAEGPSPQGAVPQAPISAEDIARHESEAAATPGIKPEDVGEEATRRIMTQHSIALGPEDKRVTLRINPDTGSLRTTGAYFIPGDPAHERMLSGVSAEHRAKLAPISTAIGRGDPFTFLHYSAPEEDIEAEEAARERPTAETRQYEQRQSTAEQRAAGAEGQLQRATIIPQQFNVTKPKKATKNKPAVPSKILLEGFASDKALNNAVHGINDAKIANVAVPYQDTGFNFQKDLAGYIQNQHHGFRGDGSGPMMDASNLPVKAYQAEMAKPHGQQYVPHLLSPEQAMFINMAMNIVPSGTTRPEKERPTFSENAQWLSRVNQGYIGQEGGVNRMREEFDRKMPHVGIRNKKGDVTRRVPWSKGVLEPTYAAFRLENIHSTLPSPLEAQSLRAREGVPHEAHIIQKAPIAVHTAGEFKIPAWQTPKPAPISENPEMGAPVGESGAMEGPEPISDDPEMGAPVGERSKNAPFKKTVKAYKLFRTDPRRPGELFPLFVLHNQSVPIGKWVKAEAGPAGKSGGVKSKLGELAYRPGFHAGDMPVATHIGGKSQPDLTKPDYRPANQTWAEVEMPNDVNWQKVADANARTTKAGKPHAATAHITDQIPFGGHYRYKTNPNMMGNWLISGNMKVNKVLSNEEVKAINDANGVADLPPEGSPISENPEMGAPVGEGQEAAEKPTPGLLKTAGTPAEEQPDYTQESAAGFNPRQLGGSYPEPQIPEQAPPEIPRPGGVEFASPNIRENISYQSAKRALKGPAQQRLRSFGDRLEEAASHHLGLEQARNSDLIGDWVDGAENSTITNYGNHPPEVRKIVSALKGLHGGQKNVARFHFDPDGPHDYYKLAFDSDNVEDVRKALSEEGVNFRSIEPSEKGKRVVAHIIDPGRYNREGVENLIKSGKIYEAESRSGHAEFPGDPNEKSRYDAARNFRGILQEARDQAYQGEGGRGDQPLQWWEPFEKEAEESFRQLRENDLFKKQAQAEDQRRAAIDREDISPENQAQLDALHGIGKDWTAQHPDINERPGFAKSTFAYLLGHKKFPRDDMTKREIGEFFDHIHDTLDFNKPAHREIAADSLLFDIMHSLAGTLTGKPSTAYGWYDRTVSKTMAKVATFLPKVAEDPAHELAFKIGLAATSQGQDVFPNAESAYHVYKYWEKHGKLPEDRKFFGGGTKAEQMEENFKKINELWDTHGTDKLREILEEPMSVKKLEEKYGLQVSGEAKGHTVRGAMGMGPKIGSFLSNLLGHFDSTTMDLWFSRNLNMIAGNMFGFSEKPMKQGTTDYAPQLEDLKKLLDSGDITAASPEAQEKMRKEIAKLEAVKEGKMTRTKALKLAPELHNWAEQATKNYSRSYRGTEGFEDMPAAFKRSFHPDFDTPENGLAKRMHENVQELSDAPRNASERDNWRKVMGRVNEKLAEHGVHLTNADKQALGWFDIKDLFKLAGSNSKQNADYLDAAYQLARRLEYGEIPDLTEVE